MRQTLGAEFLLNRSGGSRPLLVMSMVEWHSKWSLGIIPTERLPGEDWRNGGAPHFYAWPIQSTAR